jgi:hypothetical protein
LKAPTIGGPRVRNQSDRTQRNKATAATKKTCKRRPFQERLKGFEPSTFCMASRRSSQLSYSRAGAEYSRGWGALGAALDVVGGVELELEPREAAAALDPVAAPAVREPIDEQ